MAANINPYVLHPSSRRLVSSTYRCLEICSSAPLIMQPNAPSEAFRRIFLFLRHSPPTIAKTTLATAKTKTGIRHDSEFTSYLFQHIVIYSPSYYSMPQRRNMSSVSIAPNHYQCPKKLLAARCYVGSCSAELVTLKCVVLQDLHPTDSRPIRTVIPAPFATS